MTLGDPFCGRWHGSKVRHRWWSFLTAKSSTPVASRPIECRWCSITPELAQHVSPLCLGGEEHEFGRFVPCEPGEVKADYPYCPHCSDGQAWNPTVMGNVESCYHCGGTGYAGAGCASAEQVGP